MKRKVNAFFIFQATPTVSFRTGRLPKEHRRHMPDAMPEPEAARPYTQDTQTDHRLKRELILNNARGVNSLLSDSRAAKQSFHVQI